MEKPDYTGSIYKINFKPAPELKEYLNWRALGGYTESYAESISHSVTFFLRFIGKNTPISEINGADLDAFVEYLTMKEYATATIKLYAGNVSGFLKYMVLVGAISVAPQRSIPIRMTEREKAVDVRYLTNAEVIKIRQAAARGPKPSQPLWRSIRHKLVIELLISTGMRKSELPSILIENIDLPGCRMKIYGKKNSLTRRNKGKSGWRVVPLTGMSVTYIKEWINLRPEDTPELLNDYSGKDADYAVQLICVRAGLIKEGTKRSWVGPHKFRHHFATTLYLKGVEVGVIADQMGDEMGTLTRYIHAEREHDTAYLGSLME